MIILKSETTAPKAVTQIVIESAGTPSISLQGEEVNKRVGDKWEPDADNRRQVVVFNDSDGQPAKLTGVVGAGECVALDGAAYKVVLDIEIALKRTAAREAGGFSGQFAALNVVRVVEVWTTAEKPAWTARTAAKTPAGAEFDPATGKIASTRKAAA